MNTLVKAYAFKFCCIGVINTVLQQISYWLLVSRGYNYGIAQIISFILTMGLSFLLNSTFNYRISLTAKSCLSFWLANMPALILQSIILSVLVEGFGLNKEIALVFTLGITMPLSFILITRGMLQNRNK